jgi:hypothetical protein
MATASARDVQGLRRSQQWGWILLILLARSSLAFAATKDPQALLVAPRNTPIYLRPDPHAARAVAGSNSSALKFVVFEDHGAVEGGFRAVALSTNEGCYPSWWTIHLKAHSYIRADSITTVTTRPLLLQSADGTGMWLNAGVAVTPARSASRLTVHLADVAAQVPVDLIPQDALGTSFVNPKPTDTALGLPHQENLDSGYPDDVFVLLPGAQVWAGKASLRLPGPQIISTDQHHRVTWSSPCFEVIARAPRKAVTMMTEARFRRRWAIDIDDPPHPLNACSIEVLDLGNGPTYTKVAHVYLPSGEEIGTVDGCLPLDRETVPAATRRCFFIYLDGPRPGAKPMHLCFDPDAVRFHR